MRKPQTHSMPAGVLSPFGLHGPVEPSSLPAKSAAKVQDFEQGADSALALLVTSTTGDAQAWLALVEGLKARGVPVVATSRLSEALRHRVVLVYPGLSGLTPQQVQALRVHQEQGGALVDFGEVPDWAKSLTGVDHQNTGRAHASLSFGAEEELPEVELGCFWATQYQATADAQVLATYDDGSSAVIENLKNHVYTVGLDIGGFQDMASNARQSGWGCKGQTGIAKHYADHDEAYADTPFRWIQRLYRQYQPGAVTLSPVPQGKALAVVLTHDVDTDQAPAVAVRYARWENSQNLPSTYFIQTKYLSDWEDVNFFKADSLPDLEKLIADHRDIGSHSVSHSPVFNKMPLGTGLEQYPSYRPLVRSKAKTDGASILGELRVSRYLLKSLLGVQITAFRPGYLEYPEQLPQALAATGYRYSSNTTAPDSLSVLPLHAHVDRGPTQEVDEFDFPVTFSDDDPVMLPRLPDAVRLAQSIAKEHGIFVLLIHPNAVGDKLAFEQQWTQEVRPFSWFGSIDQLGDFWSARDRVTVAVTLQSSSEATITLSAPKALRGLTLELPAGWSLLPSDTLVSQQGATAVLGTVRGQVQLRMYKAATENGMNLQGS